MQAVENQEAQRLKGKKQTQCRSSKRYDIRHEKIEHRVGASSS